MISSRFDALPRQQLNTGELVACVQQVFEDGSVGGEVRELVLSVDGVRSELELGRWLSNAVDDLQSVEAAAIGVCCVAVDLTIHWRAVRVAL